MLQKDELDAGLVSITEVLFHDRYDVLDSIAKNPAERNRLHYLGLVIRPEFASKMETIEETIAPRTASREGASSIRAWRGLMPGV